jgi:hypothetical protein
MIQTIAKVGAIETAIAHVVGCNPWIAIDTAVPRIIECGGVSDDELAATVSMVRPVHIACGCASGHGHTHHHQYDETLHDASPSVKIIWFLAQFLKFARDLNHTGICSCPVAQMQ